MVPDTSKLPATSRLDALFAPRSAALVGASDTPGTLGAVVLRNLQAGGFRGPLYLVNTRHTEIAGLPVYRQLGDLPARVDVAIIMTPAASVPALVSACGESGIPAAIILSSGFRDAGEAGAARERELLRRARQAGVRLLGPNCLGLIRPATGFNATFSAAQALPGRLAIVSQSGALCTAILDWAYDRGIGFSSVISTGTAADVDFGEILDFLVRDGQTDSIMLYIEGVRGARRFMSALRAAARVKPVVVMKAGRHAEGSRAAASHTGALVGSDLVFAAALRRAGVLRVRDFADFFSAAATLGLGLRTRGRRVAIVTNAGGPGVMAADHAANCGLELAGLAAGTRDALAALLPPAAAIGNPVDVLGDADAARYVAAARLCLADPGVDVLLAILTPQALTEPETVASGLLTAERGGKAVFACWMGGRHMATSRARLRDRGVPNFATPEAAMDAIGALAAFAANQRQLLEVPEPMAPSSAPDRDGARMIVAAARSDGREWLNPAESKAVLAAFGVPILRSLPAHSAAEAVLVAEELGLPVAMKVLSADVVHKSDVGGVRLNLASAEAVRDAYGGLLADVASAQPGARVDGVLVEPMYTRSDGRELMVGVLADDVFGPVISFGLGGRLVEVMGDRSVALPPLNRVLARDLMARSRASRLLNHFRGAPPASSRAVEDLLLRISELVCELPGVLEMDLNPVMADSDGATVIDARLRIGSHGTGNRPYAHMAIHPYPADLVRPVRLRDGTRVTLRPIRPEDAEIERAFVNGLSEQARFMRFMYALHEITPAMLSRFTQIDYDREMAFIAVHAEADREVEVGVARYATLPDEASCEFAIVVGDAWQGRGLARELLGLLIDTARARGLSRMTGTTLASNHRMQDLARNLGFAVAPEPGDSELARMTLRLQGMAD